MKPSMKHTLLLLLSLAVFGWLLGETLGVYQRAGKEDFLNELVFGCTKWSKGFTDAKFRAVRTGMPSAEVRRILGDPVLEHTDNDGRDVWHYAYGKRPDKNGVYADCDYTERAVIITDGKVSSVTRGFYFD